MDWKLTFRNLRTGQEVERVFRERAEFVSRARAVDEDIWSELLSATDPNGNVLTVDEVRRLVAANEWAAERSRPAAGPTAPPPRRVWPRARPARARIALSPAPRSSRAPPRAWPDASRARPALRESTCRRGHRPRPPPRRAPANPPPRLSVAPRACSRAPKKARCDGWRWRGSSCRRGRPFHLQHAHLAREQQHADEQPLDLLEKAPPKRGDRVVVGVVVGGDVAERHAVVSRPLKLAARKHPGGVAVNQNPQQHPGWCAAEPEPR